MKVSVVITTFNRSNLLKRAIESVLAQEYRDFELFILDNSSSDDTEGVVRGYRDSRIVYIKHKPLGISEARNLGTQKARGEFVGFLDDDDEWLPCKLSLQVPLFDRSSPKVGLVYGGFVRVREDGSVYETGIPSLRGNVLQEYLCGGWNPLGGSASNALMRKEVFAKVGGYDAQLKTSEDWEFYLRLAREYEFDFVKDVVVRVGAHQGPRLGDRLEAAAETELHVYKEFEDILEKNKRCKSYYLQTIGGKYVRAGKAKVGRQYLARSIVVRPLNIIACVQYACSFFGTSLYRAAHAWYQYIRE